MRNPGLMLQDVRLPFPWLGQSLLKSHCIISICWYCQQASSQTIAMSLLLAAARFSDTVFAGVGPMSIYLLLLHMNPLRGRFDFRAVAVFSSPTIWTAHCPTKMLFMPPTFSPDVRLLSLSAASHLNEGIPVPQNLM